ncbi:uncharacterized protein KNAG_0F01390 [Huiozyma naganishii CBS 8797]|uniref:Uncharacterized protein n=1 Tax=Huiozyma naganishii (strain ATCC MYA-139 / BCRC 22969 / CBS 8797 / KCTC 17520 / NBRC 10181 / NCYC 3082 / Yp74L-3) TaxID=1071383 RepID=J7RZX6_HUIN7|nr:hypothetical protein KNAG_0F01390 [Kazachstania naganishii CBS 8797]CCK70807.1 hypothetical protein KNAG_0F01390 [Kazachstania naganishii CBS 8797]
MDRVRVLLSGGFGSGDAVDTVTLPLQHDDQETAFELGDDDDGNGNGDLQTLVSDSVTIGDLQRLGFVNRCPPFHSQRVMPFVSVLLSKGIWAFPSENSLAVYLRNKRQLDKVDYDAGVGVPLFHAVMGNTLKSVLFMNKQQGPVMRVYKYEIVHTKDVNAYTEGQVVHEQGTRALIKFEFCNVFKAHLPNSLRVDHTFTFYNGQSVTMSNYRDKRDIDTRVARIASEVGSGSRGLHSPFGSNDYQTASPRRQHAHFPYKQRATTITSTYYNGTTEETPRGAPRLGKYSDANVSMIPKKRILTLATFKINEFAPSNGDGASDGILNIHWDTQVLTCMCLLLHEYESRKERRHANSYG